MRRDGTPLALLGKVRHCRHLQGACHEIGIEFEIEIDPHSILMPEELDAAGLQPSPGHAVNIPSLAGRLLLADDSDSDRILFSHQISATGLAVTGVATCGAAIDQVKRSRFDIVVCALNLNDSNGIYAVQQIREVGFRGPLLVMTAEMSPKVLNEVQRAGADEVVGKPYDPGYIMYLLGECLQQSEADDPVYSRFDDEPAMAELLAQYIDETHRRVHDLTKAVAVGDLSVVRELCIRLAGSGANYGFDQLSAAAADALRNLDAADDLDSALVPVRRLLSICHRVQQGRGQAISGPSEGAVG